MHFACAYLHFQRLVFGTDDGGVQRLVIIGFRLCDVIVELALNRLPKIMDQRQHRVAIADGIDQNTNCANVIKFFERDIFRLHFAVNRKYVFRAPGKVRIDAELVQVGAKGRQYPAYICLAFIAFAVKQRGNAFVEFRLEITKTEILQLPLDLKNAQAIGKRCEQVIGLLPGSAAGCVIGLGDRAHEDDALGKFDEDHAHIVGQRQQHLAQRFKAWIGCRISGLHRDTVDAPCTLYAVDQHPHLGPKGVPDDPGIDGAARHAANDERGGDGFIVGVDVDQYCRGLQRTAKHLLAHASLAGPCSCSDEIQGTDRDFAARKQLPNARTRISVMRVFDQHDLHFIRSRLASPRHAWKKRYIRAWWLLYAGASSLCVAPHC